MNALTGRTRGTPQHVYQRARTSRLRTQLLLNTVIPVTALLLALSLVGVFGFTRLTQALVEQRDAELVQLAAQQVARYWAESVLLLTNLADPLRTITPQASQALLQANEALGQRFDQVHIVNAEGTIVASRGGEIGGQVPLLSYLERARRLRRPVRSEIYQDAQGRPVIAVAVAIYDVRGAFNGYAIGIWELRGHSLGVPVREVRVGDHGYAFVVDQWGTVLYHPVEDMLGASFRQHPVVAALLRGETGAQMVNTGGRATVVGYAPIPLRQLPNSVLADESWDGWGLLTSEEWRHIVEPLQPYITLMVVLLILVITLPMILLVVNSRRIAAPLQSLADQAERVASGEFESHVSINAGPLEVRELEEAFNVMVEQLRKYRSDIQSYVVSILNSQEEERKRIGRELHDETAQALIVLGRRIEIAQEMAKAPELKAELGTVRDMIDDTLQGVRRFTSDLRPPLLEELGLPRTLELLGARTEREEGFSVNVSIMGEPIQLLPELELGLYRLAQESLSNVRRHAHASHVQVLLSYSPDAVKLSIADDGVGFDAPTDPITLAKTGRLGLIGIHERARLFGGKAKITSKPGQGTVVTVAIPLTPILLPSTEARQEIEEGKH